MILFGIFVLIGLALIPVVRRGFKIGARLSHINYEVAAALRNGDINRLDICCMCLAYVVLSPLILVVKLRTMWRRR